LKQPLCVWNYKIDAYFLAKEFERNYVNHNVCFKKVYKKKFVIIIFFVDDLILACNDNSILLKETNDNILKKFEMEDLGEI
jgi:hypothetical protein